MYRVFHKTNALTTRPFAVPLPELPALAMKALPRQPMPALTTIQLSENAAAITWVIDECQQMQGFWNAKFAQGSRQQGSLASSLQGMDQFGRAKFSHLQGAGHP